MEFYDVPSAYWAKALRKAEEEQQEEKSSLRKFLHLLISLF